MLGGCHGEDVTSSQLPFHLLPSLTLESLYDKIPTAFVSTGCRAVKNKCAKRASRYSDHVIRLGTLRPASYVILQGTLAFQQTILGTFNTVFSLYVP